MIDYEKLKKYLQLQEQDSRDEGAISGMFSGSYWDGKADAFREILNKIEKNND